MPSKKKANGRRSVRCVEEAIQKCGCTTAEFFARVAVIDGIPNSFNTKAELEKYINFRTLGVSADPDYKIPKRVLALADKIHASKHPRNYFKSLRPSARRAASAHA